MCTRDLYRMCNIRQSNIQCVYCMYINVEAIINHSLHSSYCIEICIAESNTQWYCYCLLAITICKIWNQIRSYKRFCLILTLSTHPSRSRFEDRNWMLLFGQQQHNKLLTHIWSNQRPSNANQMVNRVRNNIKWNRFSIEQKKMCNWIFVIFRF